MNDLDIYTPANNLTFITFTDIKEHKFLIKYVAEYRVRDIVSFDCFCHEKENCFVNIWLFLCLACSLVPLCTDVTFQKHRNGHRNHAWFTVIALEYVSVYS